MFRAQMTTALAVSLLMMVAPWALAQAATEEGAASSDTEATIAALQRQVDQLSNQLRLLQEQLDQLKSQQEEAAAKARRERIRQAAQARLAESAGPKVDTQQSFESGTRMQAQLNPEISVTGDLFLVAGEDLREELRAGHFELDLRSYLDPFSVMHVVLGFSDSAHHGEGDEEGDEEDHEHQNAEVEEAYITWLQLPANLSLTLGKKRQQYGVLNRWHEHALDQADLPWVLEHSFGDEGLAGTGLSVDWLMPRLWADANELTVEVTNGDNDVAFAGADWSDPTILARLKSYWDLNTDTYLEIGLSGLHGASDADGERDHTFYALDLGFNWNPAGRELYRDVTVRGMLQRSERDLGPAGCLDTWGGFLYGQSKLSRSLIAGLRYDRVNDVYQEDHRFWGLSPYLTYWQSEFVRLRLQAGYREDNQLGSDLSYLLQVTFSAGPHKHETY
jgi:hypothetical protein